MAGVPPDAYGHNCPGSPRGALLRHTPAQGRESILSHRHAAAVPCEAPPGEPHSRLAPRPGMGSCAEPGVQKIRVTPAVPINRECAGKGIQGVQSAKPERIVFKLGRKL